MGVLVTSAATLSVAMYTMQCFKCFCFFCLMKVLEFEFIFEETDGQGLRGKTIHCAVFNTSTFPVVGGSEQLICAVSYYGAECTFLFC